MNDKLIHIEAIQERDTDMLLLEEIKCNRNFTDWLLKRTIRLNNKYELLGAWHSLTQVRLGESDIAFKIRTDDCVFLFLIENKIDVAFQSDQALRYRKRGNHQKEKGECHEFYTILFAPGGYIRENKDFDFTLPYEDVREWFLSQRELGERGKFKADILEIAIEKRRRGYMPIADDAVTSFRWDYYKFIQSNYPDLGMLQPPAILPATSGFIRFKPHKLNLERGEYIIHKVRGNIDLQLSRHGNNLESCRKAYSHLLNEEMEIRPTNKSIAIRIRIPKLDLTGSFSSQMENIDIAVKKIKVLCEWADANLK